MDAYAWSNMECMLETTVSNDTIFLWKSMCFFRLGYIFRPSNALMMSLSCLNAQILS